MLLIGPEEQAALKKAMKLARERPVPIRDILRATDVIDQATDVVTLAERGAIPERPAVQMVELPIGYRVNISYEVQPAGLCLHLSMSSSAKGKVPSAQAVAMVLDAINIRGFSSRTWIEEYLVDGQLGGHAVNVVVLITPAEGGHA